MALPEDREYQPTTADDIHKVFDCWTRLEVLIALSGRTRPIGIVTQALALSHNVVQMHTATLHNQGLLQRTRDGKHAFFTLSGRAHILLRPAEIMIEVAADDGAVLSMRIPRSSPTMRLIAAGLWARDHDSPERAPVIEVRSAAPGRAPTGYTKPLPHPSSGP